jgi:hypothetical protein
MKLYTLILVSVLLFSKAGAQSQFTRFELPLQVSVEVPQNWWLLSKDWNTTIQAAGQAAAKLAGLELPVGKKVNLLRANSMPLSTYATIAVNATDSDISPDELSAASRSDLQEMEELIAAQLKASLAPANIQLLEFLGLERRIVSGHVAIVFAYRRSDPKGPVTVSMTRLYLGSKEISFNLSFRDAEGVLWKPIIEYMKQSISVGKSN